jgi:hypothetical protein
MKFACACGVTVFDATDGLPHKGHLVPDRAWLALLDALDAEVLGPLAAGRLDEPAASYRARTLLIGAARPVYQCAACGRLYVDVGGAEVLGYVPETPAAARPVLRRHGSTS